MNSGRTTTRYLPEWQTKPSQPGVSASTSDQTITISGVPTVGDVVGTLIDRAAYAYRIQAGDTADLVASNLNVLIQADRPATVQGSTIALPGARSVVVRVVCDAATSFESRRQEKDLRVICWCPSPSIRDAVAAAIDLAIDQFSLPGARRMIPRPASYTNIPPVTTRPRMRCFTEGIWFIRLSMPTVAIVTQPSMLFGASDINGNITYG